MATLKTLLIQAPAGGTSISHPLLAYADIKTLHRQGSLQYPISALPTGTEANYYFQAGLGKCSWSIDRAFNYAELDETGSRIIEYISIVYTDQALIN